MATNPSTTPKSTDAPKRGTNGETTKAKDDARKQAEETVAAAKAEAQRTELRAQAEAERTRQAADAYATQTRARANAEADETRTAAEHDVQTTVAAVSKEDVRDATELTRQVWERNIELAVSLAPAYLDAYERAAKSFGNLHRQTGQTVAQVGEGVTGAPRPVGEVLVQANQAAAQLPQVIGESLTAWANALGRLPEAMLSTTGAQVPQAIPALADAQAKLVDETVEAAATAARTRLTR
jgi:hypothetical protein